MMLANFDVDYRDRLPSANPTIRVLHIVENLNNQAVESWLLRVARVATFEYPHVQWTLFCTLGEPGKLDPIARDLGVEVIHSRYQIGDKVRFIRGLRRVMQTGRYDILHCHHDVMSASYLLAAQGVPFRKRIVHVHNTSLSLPTPNRLKANLAREPMRQMCLRMADKIVGISRDALSSMTGSTVANGEQFEIVHYGVDTSKVRRAKADRCSLRDSFDLPHNAKILLFVGRMVEYKNPLFMLDILDHLRSQEEVVAVFAGCGDQEERIRSVAESRTLQERVRVIGFRDDIPELMLNSDLLIWPSLESPKEGLGLGIVEAQAAGLPVLMSLSVPDEAVVVPELVDSLPLAGGSAKWAAKALEILQRQRPDPKDCLTKVEASSFSLPEGVKNLMGLYNLSDEPDDRGKSITC